MVRQKIQAFRCDRLFDMLIELTKWTREFRYLWGVAAGLCFLAYLQFSRNISMLPGFLYDFILEACQRGKRLTIPKQSHQVFG